MERVVSLTSLNKPFLNFFCPWEDALFGSMRNYFGHLQKLQDQQMKITEKNIIEFSRIQKAAAGNIKTLISERNIVSNDYYKAKMSLIDKKNKRLELDFRLWELDVDLMRKIGVEPKLMFEEDHYARRFLYKEETKKLRDYGELFALFNAGVFQEVMFHEKYYFRKMVTNFLEFKTDTSVAVTEFHHVLADLSSNLNDIASYTSRTFY